MMEESISLLQDDWPKLLSKYNIDLNPVNLTTTELDLFFHCFRLPHCPACLAAKNPYPCSWCETSGTCVPNTVFSVPFGILASIKSDDICPLGWRERWEMRAKPFSCRCSSMTFLSVVVAVVTTLVGVLVIWVGVRLGIWMGRKWRARKEGWWRVSEWTPRWVKKDQRKDAATETEADDRHGHEPNETSPFTLNATNKVLSTTIATESPVQPIRHQAEQRTVVHQHLQSSDQRLHQDPYRLG
jgi:hypothetical protein